MLAWESESLWAETLQGEAIERVIGNWERAGEGREGKRHSPPKSVAMVIGSDAVPIFLPLLVIELTVIM